MSASLTSTPGLWEPPQRPRGPLAVRFVLLALLLHAGLFLLPLSLRDVSVPVEALVELTLMTPAPPPSEAVVRPEPRPDPPPEPLPQPRPQQPPAPPVTEILDLPPPPVPQVEPETPPLPPLDTEAMLRAIAEIEARESPEAPRTLGRDTSSPIYDRLSRPVLATAANEFDGTVAPSEVEIVDRWMSAGGVHEVVIRSPDGNTYCGRQEPVDDLRPWLQMPMMFRTCAGGGKRKSGGSWRNN